MFLTGSKKLLVWNVYGLTEATVVQTALLLNSFLDVTTVAQSDCGPTRTDNASRAAACSCIGTPMLNCSVALLPVPVAADSTDFVSEEKTCEIRGEICIQGPQLSRGYLNDPILTQSRFCERKDLAPLCWGGGGSGGGASNFQGACCASSVSTTTPADTTQPPRRSVWLKTGDLGWWDGHRLHVVGRLDNQVKFRGRRVDLGEVDAALVSTPPAKVRAAR